MRSPEGAPYFWNSFLGAGFGRPWQPFSFPTKNLSSSPDIRNLIMLMNMLNFFIIILGDFLSEMNTAIEVYKLKRKSHKGPKYKRPQVLVDKKQLQMEIKDPVGNAKRNITAL